MSILGDLVGSFTGSTAKKLAGETYDRNTAINRDARDQGLAGINQGYDQAYGLINPYAQSGTQANSMYTGLLGLSGADTQRGLLAQYANADPFRQFNEDLTNKSLARSYNRMGMLDSGNFRMAAARANLERGSQDYNSYLARLAGLSQQGMGAAGQLGGYAMNRGQGIANLWNGYANNQNAAEVNRGNSLAQASGIFGNNIMKLASMAVSAATGMPVGMGGTPGDKGGSNFMGNSGGNTPFYPSARY